MTVQKSILPEQFRLTVQTAVPPAGDRQGLTEFICLLETARQLGMYGVELNVPDLEETIPAADLRELLAKYQLRLTYIASGIYAAKRGLALASADAGVREASVEGWLANMRYAQEAGENCGVIIGTLKGSPQLAETEGAQRRLEDSLREGMVRARQEGLDVPVLLEATNHYEASAVNTVAQAAETVKAAASGGLFVLPDTYHMNIEEKDAFEAVRTVLPLMRNIHISDNNRYFPGFGAIDFARWYTFLNKNGYRGTYGIEGRLIGSLCGDLEESVRFLEEVL